MRQMTPSTPEIDPNTSAPIQAEPPLASRVVRGGMVVAGASYATIIIGFGATIIMARLVSPEAFGMMAIASFLFGLLNLRTKSGLGQSFVRHPETSGRTIGTLVTLDLISGLLSILLVLVAIPFLQYLNYNPQVAPILAALALINLIDVASNPPALLLDKNLVLGRTTIVGAVGLTLAYIPAIWMAMHGWGVWSLVAQAALQTILIVVGTWWAARKSLGSLWLQHWVFDWQLAKHYLYFGVFWGAATLAGLLATQLDNFLVGTFVGLTILGFYDRAYRLASWPSLLVSNIVARSSFLAYARLQNDQVRLSRTVEMTIWIITTLALPLVVAIFVVAPDLVLFLLGDQWLPTALFLRVLLVVSLMRPLLEDVSGLLTAVGKQSQVSFLTWIQVLVVVVVAAPLTFAFGAVGTAIGVSVSFLIVGTLFYFRISQFVRFDWWKTLGLPVLVAGATVGLYLLVNPLFGWDNLPLLIRLIFKSVLTIAVFYALLLAVQRRSFMKRAQYVWQLARGKVS